MLENFFKLQENGTTIKTEIIGGITTFFCHGIHFRNKSHTVI
jgi:xanthine/uracil/vitamin C permease (AzgA family)